MTIQKIEGEFAVCQVADYSQVNLDSAYCFVGKTDEERSLVCLSTDVPANVTACDRGWRALRVQGPLDFSLIGILARLSSLLAENGIGLFAVSTYNTDYILVKQDAYRHALEVLVRAGYPVED